MSIIQILEMHALTVGIKRQISSYQINGRVH